VGEIVHRAGDRGTEGGGHGDGERRGRAR
jgi:hypothetical protein